VPTARYRLLAAVGRLTPPDLLGRIAEKVGL